VRCDGHRRQRAAGLLARLGRALPQPEPHELGRRISRHREAIDAALNHRLYDGPVESTNTKIWLLTRMALGLKSPEATIAPAMPNLPGDCPPPSRQAA